LPPSTAHPTTKLTSLPPDDDIARPGRVSGARETTCNLNIVLGVADIQSWLVFGLPLLWLNSRDSVPQFCKTALLVPKPNKVQGE